MEIPVTKEIIEETSGIRSDIRNCLVARSVKIATGRPCTIGGSYSTTGHFDDNNESFEIDDAARKYIWGYIRHGNQHRCRILFWWRILQPEGSFEISYNPPKNWQYLQDTHHNSDCAPTVEQITRFNEVLVSR